jgi:hypothetical protein
MEDVLSYNVGIKGSEHPENIMVVGGHLDSWDLLMVLMMTEQEWCKVEVLNIFKNLGINLIRFA